MVTPKPPRTFRGMRRLTLTGAGTATALVLLFSYRTSTGDSGTDTAQAVGPAQVISGNTPGEPSTSADPAGTSEGSAPATQRPTSSKVAPPAATADTPPTTTADTPTTTVSSTASNATITVDGAQEMTRYGVVQVQVTIAGGRITDVSTLQYPDRESRDVEINSYAIPQLRAEVIAAQSAKVDAVSGATYTSEGYLASLQAALDAAGFKS